MSSDSFSLSERTVIELRRRLEEAEETLRAIREGEVDALVMRNPRDEDEVFTLEGGTESYRAFMEVMDIGAAAFDNSGRLLYANRTLGELLDVEAGTIEANHLFQSLSESDRTIVRDLVDRAHLAKASHEIILARDGEERHIQVSASPLTLGLSQGVAVTFTDITPRIRELAAQESERAARAIMASANEAVIVCDRNGIITHANAAVLGITRDNPVGLLFEDAIPIVVPDATGLMQGNEFVSLAISGTPVQGIEAHAPNAPRVRDLLISAAPLKLVTGVVGCVVTMVDLSQRKAAEKQQLLLMGELDHRVKNTLALVLSIAKRTASTEDTVDGFQSAFSNRIQALAATHNILAERSWKAVSVHDVVRTELEPYVDDMQSRLSIQGEEFGLLPRAAIALGLVLHELATNAVKYGSLSKPAGRIQVTINRMLQKSGISVEWKEVGGPQVQEPTHKGFGQTVITKSMQYSPEGGAQIIYAADGVHCEIHVPGADVVDPVL